jgi:TonB family protein
VLILLATPCAAQQQPVSAPSGNYTDNEGGLEKLAKKILDSAKKGDSTTVEAGTRALLLPNPDAWFKSVFGEEQGAFFARAYSQSESTYPPLLAREFDELVKDKIDHLKATRFQTACDPYAMPMEYPVLVSRIQNFPLYDLRAVQPDAVRYIWAFAYVDGGFRYLGNLRSVASFRHSKSRVEATEASPGEAGAQDKATKRIKVDKSVQQAKLIHFVQPEYPAEAKAAHLQGEVLLHAMVGKDGSLQDLELIEGHCWLTQSALKAVMQWKYRPTMIEGQPVEVDTTITVKFTLGRLIQSPR